MGDFHSYNVTPNTILIDAMFKCDQALRFTISITSSFKQPYMDMDAIQGAKIQLMNHVLCQKKLLATLWPAIKLSIFSPKQILV